MGLSSVKLSQVEWSTAEGPVLHVLGADLMNGTPIYDIKPYVAYTDSHEGARSGFVDDHQWHPLRVVVPDSLAARIPADLMPSLVAALEQDPRPQYHDNPDKVYGMSFAGRNVRFRVADGVLTVLE